jgi:hypothetical protein
VCLCSTARRAFIANRASVSVQHTQQSRKKSLTIYLYHIFPLYVGRVALFFWLLRWHGLSARIALGRLGNNWDSA